MNYLGKAFLGLIGTFIWAVIVYAGCVYWPFHWSTKVGYIIGGIIIITGFIQFIVTIIKKNIKTNKEK